MLDYLRKNLEFMGLEVAEEALAKIWRYWLILNQENGKFNLISPKREMGERVIIHLVDSLSPLLAESLKMERRRVLDLGSGGGLPAIPLALVNERWHYDLYESTGKKAVFLNEVKSQLRMENVSVYNSYLEKANLEVKGKYDLTQARAVGGLADLVPIMANALKAGGLFMAMKGPRVYEELKEARHQLKRAKMEIVEELKFKLPVMEAERIILIFKKFKDF